VLYPTGYKLLITTHKKYHNQDMKHVSFTTVSRHVIVSINDFSRADTNIVRYKDVPEDMVNIGNRLL